MPSNYDIIQAAASVYAESLLQLATESKTQDAVAEDLAGLAELWKREPTFALLMTSAGIEQDARRQSIRSLFAGKVSEIVLNLLLVLNDNYRSVILPALCDAYMAGLEAQRGQKRAFVTSSVPLTPAQRGTLTAQIQRIVGAAPILVEKVDPHLLGGLRVQVDDRVIDQTVRSRLRRLTSVLHAACDHRLLERAMELTSPA